MKTRKLAKPIFSIPKVEVTQPKPPVADEPMDIIMIDDKSDESIEEIELEFSGNEDEYETPAKFWRFMDQLKWKDKSELPEPRYHWYNKQNTEPDFNNFNMASLKSFKAHFWKYFNELKSVFDEKEVFSSFERELTTHEQNILLSHIIAKGQVYYATIMNEPYFCGALISKNKNNDEFEDFLKYIR